MFFFLEDLDICLFLYRLLFLLRETHIDQNLYHPALRLATVRKKAFENSNQHFLLYPHYNVVSAILFCVPIQSMGT